MTTALVNGHIVTGRATATGLAVLIEDAAGCSLRSDTHPAAKRRGL